MIKAKINKTYVEAELNGDLATIMGELHGFLNNVLTDIAEIANDPKQHLLTMLYQNILKEWSEENEND